LLVRMAAKHPDLLVDDPNSPIDVLPRPWEVAVTGLHFLLPIVILIWCILLERLSPTLSAYWASVAMIFIVVTQKPLKALFRKQTLAGAFSEGWRDCFQGMVGGARNMIGIGVATGAAGIIVGTVSLTGAHQVIGELVEYLSGGSLITMLLLVAMMSLILGLGLPTTANYIVVSSLMVPVIVAVGAQSGLVVPLVAVHLFVFYFGILADDTPPVGLAAFAAAAISGGDPIRTGVQGFTYDIRTALLPFLFIFNTELLLFDVTLGKAVLVFVVAVIAMMLFAAATQRYFFTRNRWWESIALLVVAFTLFRPGFWLDFVEPPYQDRAGKDVFTIAEAQPHGEPLRLVVNGPDFDDPDKVNNLTLLINMPGTGEGSQRLESAGLLVSVEEGRALLEEPIAGMEYFEELSIFDYYADHPVTIEKVQLKTERMYKEIFYIPALALLALVILAQYRRRAATTLQDN